MPHQAPWKALHQSNIRNLRWCSLGFNDFDGVGRRLLECEYVIDCRPEPPITAHIAGARFAPGNFPHQSNIHDFHVFLIRFQ